MPPSSAEPDPKTDGIRKLRWRRRLLAEAPFLLGSLALLGLAVLKGRISLDQASMGATLIAMRACWLGGTAIGDVGYRLWF